MTQAHISTQYDTDLEALRGRVQEMGAMVSSQFRLAVEALRTDQSDLADQVVMNDKKVNDLEVEIDNACAHLIARRQPQASDLRMVLGVSKMVTDMERIGDKARKIARLSGAIRNSTITRTEWMDATQHVAEATLTLLNQTLQAIVHSDLDAAIAVIRSASGIGRQVNALLSNIVQRMTESPSQIAVLLDMMAITKAMDRVADHASNLSEHLIYIVKGIDVRHATLDQIEREAMQR